jgi:hypothetical protein
MNVVKLVATALFTFATFAAANAAYADGSDLLAWTDCPPGIPYSFGDPQGAHFQASPVAGPSGGACSLEVVSGAQVIPAASSTGGVAFATPGEVAGGTYTVAFDMQFVKGQDPWIFTNQSGQGDTNGLSFPVTYPGDTCWHRYTFTAPLGAAGPKPIYFVYQSVNGFEEMRIDNMTITPAAPGAPLGLATGGATACSACAP